jgi:hypothetical protein
MGPYREWGIEKNLTLCVLDMVNTGTNSRGCYVQGEGCCVSYRSGDALLELNEVQQIGNIPSWFAVNLKKKTHLVVGVIIICCQFDQLWQTTWRLQNLHQAPKDTL